MKSTPKRLAILGNGVTGNLAAMYFEKKFPEIEVILIGRSDRKRPIVGESTVEITTYFMKGLGLGKMLEDEQYHKYGLTFYCKTSQDRNDRQYFISQAPGPASFAGYNINRSTFDKKIRAINVERGVQFIEADVKDIRLGEGLENPHSLTIQDTEGNASELQAHWVVDATGRNRFLATKLNLKKPYPYSRDCFWFRLKNFDLSLFFKVDRICDEHHCFDPWYVTHHFFGKGYWIWLIPMRAENGENLVSIGITFRPEFSGQSIGSMSEFLALMERDHPVLKEFINSGVVMDTNLYRDYMYESEKYYSPDRWFLIGDAAFTSDPLFSTGLAVVSIQIPQIAAIIEKDMAGSLTNEYIESLESYLQLFLAVGDGISNMYEVIHDPIKMSWVKYLFVMNYFHILLPSYVNGSFLDGNQIRQITELFPRKPPGQETSPYPFARPLASFPSLFNAVAESQNSDPIPAECMATVDSGALNFGFYRIDEAARPAYVSRYFWKLAKTRVSLMRRIRWKASTAHAQLFFKHLLFFARDAMRSVMLKLRPSLFYKYGPTPASLASPFPKGSFIDFNFHQVTARPKAPSREIKPQTLREPSLAVDE